MKNTLTLTAWIMNMNILFKETNAEIKQIGSRKKGCWTF